MKVTNKKMKKPPRKKGKEILSIIFVSNICQFMLINNWSIFILLYYILEQKYNTNFPYISL
jgi:hypothetical protein